MITRRLVFSASIAMAVFAVSATTTASNLSQLSSEVTSLVRRVSPSIVELRVEQRSAARVDQQGKVVIDGSSGGMSADGSEGRVVVGARKAALRSVGSGFVIDRAGYILTTAHVVGNAEAITVGFPDGSEAQARLVGSDQVTNIAVIKVDRTGLTALDLGNSDTLEPGALVLTINNLAGMEGSVSLGVVAGLGRKVDAGADLIQISGTIGPGASGGPVLDSSGKVVGVTSAMLSPTPSALPFNYPNIILQGMDMDKLREAAEAMKLQGESLRYQAETDKVGESAEAVRKAAEAIKKVQEMYFEAAPSVSRSLLDSAAQITRTTSSSGFAVPINSIKPILEDLKAGREVERGFLGAMVEDKDGRIVIAGLQAGQAAEKAGLKKGDVLVSADGRKFDKASAFSGYIMTRKPGDTVALVVERGGKSVEVSVVLEKRPKPSETRSGALSPGIFRWSSKTFPLSLADADIAQVAKALSDASGVSVVVTEPEKIKKKATIELKSATVEKALDVICRAMGCRYKKDGDTYVISP